MTTTLPPSIPPRVIEHEDADDSARSVLSWRPPEHTLRGLLAGAEAAIGSWLVVVALTVAAYVATAAAPELGSSTWLDAARVGSAIWLLGHGGGIDLGGAAITLIPLGVTAFGLFGVAASVRRARLDTWWPLGAALLAYTAFAGGFVAFAATPGSWRGVIGAPVVAALGCLLAVRGRAPRSLKALRGKTPDWLAHGLSAGGRAVLVVLVLGLLAVVLAVVLGFSRVMDVHDSLVPDGVSSVIIVVAQVVLFPTLVVWGVAFLAGPGFAVGDGTVFSTHGIDAGPLPVVPVLGALPEPTAAVGSWGMLAGLMVLVGAGAGWWLRRRYEAALLPTLGAVAIAAVTAALVLTVLAWASSGAVGPGRMAVMGPDPLAVGLATGWQLALGAGLVALLSHPATAAGLRGARAAVGSWWEQVRAPQA